MTVVVNIRHSDDYDVYIGRASPRRGLRASPFANPFRLPDVATPAERAEAIAMYRQYIEAKPELLALLPELRGKRLGCWCAPLPCHGDVLVELVEAPR